MIYIVTAMYAEAHAFITRFQLKKELSHTRFQVFLNKEEELCLIISGTGSVAAAVAVSSICTEYGTGQEDFLVNAGVCARIWNGPEPGNETETGTEAEAGTGSIFLCSKITEETTGRTFYPDILYQHGFSEAQIITGANPYRKAGPAAIPSGRKPEKPLSAAYGNGILPLNFYLYDMEAAAVYQAGAYYFGPHQMSFLKVVSDDGNAGNVSAEQVKRLMDGSMDQTADYLSILQAVSREVLRDTTLQARRQDEPLPDKLQKEALAAGSPDIQYDFTQTDRIQEDLRKLCLDLHCSRTMSESLRQHIRYCILSGADYAAVLEEMYREGKLPCKDKREGKKCFEELKERLL